MNLIAARRSTPLRLVEGKKGTHPQKTRVLFLCTHNAVRSQMAEGFLRHLYGDRYEAFSAGAYPTQVDPLAVRAMAEVGIDISGHRAKSIEEYRGQSFDLVATVCFSTPRIACPFCSPPREVPRFLSPMCCKPLSLGIPAIPEAISSTVGARRWIEHGFSDPGDVEGGEEERMVAFRATRDGIRDWVKAYFADLS